MCKLHAATKIDQTLDREVDKCHSGIHMVSIAIDKGPRIRLSRILPRLNERHAFLVQVISNGWSKLVRYSPSSNLRYRCSWYSRFLILSRRFGWSGWQLHPSRNTDKPTNEVRCTRGTPDGVCCTLYRTTNTIHSMQYVMRQV